MWHQTWLYRRGVMLTRRNVRGACEGRVKSMRNVRHTRRTEDGAGFRLANEPTGGSTMTWIELPPVPGTDAAG